MQEDNKTPRKADAAYWCTCSDDPKLCLGCGIERLTFQVLGQTGLTFLQNRTMRLVKPEGKKK